MIYPIKVNVIIVHAQYPLDTEQIYFSSEFVRIFVNSLAIKCVQLLFFLQYFSYFICYFEQKKVVYTQKLVCKRLLKKNTLNIERPSYAVEFNVQFFMIYAVSQGLAAMSCLQVLLLHAIPCVSTKKSYKYSLLASREFISWETFNLSNHINMEKSLI